jgi:amino acid transporter
MARDKQLPAFLGKTSRKRDVPRNAILLVAAFSLVLGLYMNSRSDGITLLSSMINFGAMTAFLLLHISVVVYHLFRRRSRNLFAHLVMPLIGALILGFVIWNASIAAQRLGVVWIGLGVLVLACMYATGNRPRLSGMALTRAEAHRIPEAV